MFFPQMIYDSKDVIKSVLASCANIHHDATTFKVDGVVQNKKN